MKIIKTINERTNNEQVTLSNQNEFKIKYYLDETHLNI